MGTQGFEKNLQSLQVSNLEPSISGKWRALRKWHFQYLTFLRKCNFGGNRGQEVILKDFKLLWNANLSHSHGLENHGVFKSTSRLFIVFHGVHRFLSILGDNSIFLIEFPWCSLRLTAFPYTFWWKIIDLHKYLKKSSDFHLKFQDFNDNLWTSLVFTIKSKIWTRMLRKSLVSQRKTDIGEEPKRKKTQTLEPQLR